MSKPEAVNSIPSLHERCTGCGACVSVCPVGAISMVADAEGFKMPCVDDAVCIGCGRCTSVCQIAHPAGVFSPCSVRGLRALNAGDRAAGSSGGVFGLLAKTVLAEGGVVFGAAFDAGAKRVLHVSSDRTPIERIMRSKYVQSDAWVAYREVRDELKSGRKVLFCGTPCQVSGLLKYLGGPRPNLLTVDFFCHGVPSPGFFAEYANLREKKRGSRIVDMSFREKARGWREQHMRWYYDDGTVEEEPSLENCHYFFFLGNYSLRRSCYECDLYKRHEADVTLADYWLIDAADDDDLGTSLVLANTLAGRSVVNEVAHLLSEVPVRNFDIEIYRHGYDVKKRAEFFSRWESAGIEVVCGPFFEREHSRDLRRKWVMGHGVSCLKGIAKRIIRRA